MPSFACLMAVMRKSSCKEKIEHRKKPNETWTQACLLVENSTLPWTIINKYFIKGHSVLYILKFLTFLT